MDAFLKVAELGPDEKAIIEEQADIISKDIRKKQNKLISLYSNQPSLMEIIMDSHFFSMYVLKLLHLGIIILSLFLTEKLFSEMYMKQVYAENNPPPNLMTMLGIFAVVDFGLVLFLLTIMFLLMYVFQKPSNDFIINGDLIKSFIFDYAIFMVLFVVIMVIIALYMQSKKYFRYKTEGLRAIRALKDIALPIAIVLLVVPFFAIF
jgi:hypothetical protein